MFEREVDAAAEGGRGLGGALARNRGCLLAFAIAFGLFLGGRSVIFRQMMYPAPPVPVGSPPAMLEEVEVTGADGVRAVAWATRHVEPAGVPPPALVVFHGNGENLQTMARAGTFDDLGGLGVPFLALDYPGYGRSGGRAGQAALIAAGVAARDAVALREPGSPIVLVGWSLGGAVAVQVAASAPERLRGLVVMETWDALPGLATRHFPRWLVSWGLAEHWDSASVAGGLSLPVLMIHGTADDLVPIEHGRALRSRFGRRAGWVEVDGAGHNDLLAHDQVWRELAAFVAQVAAGPVGPAS